MGLIVAVRLIPLSFLQWVSTPPKRARRADEESRGSRGHTPKHLKSWTEAGRKLPPQLPCRVDLWCPLQHVVDAITTRTSKHLLPTPPPRPTQLHATDAISRRQLHHTQQVDVGDGELNPVRYHIKAQPPQSTTCSNTNPSSYHSRRTARLSTRCEPPTLTLRACYVYVLKPHTRKRKTR